MVLPEGFAVPPLPYVIALLVGVLVLGAWIYRLDPPFTARTVLALTPWMALGGGLHVLAILETVPADVAPLFGTPAVYVSTAMVAGLVWAISHLGANDPDRLLGVVGTFLFGLVTAIVLSSGVGDDGLGLLWPLVALVVSILVTAVVWLLIATLSPQVAAVTSSAGLAVIFSHALDGFSTAVGVDILGAGERSPLPRAIMNGAAHLPTAEYIGVGWAFVVVKLVIAVGIVWLFVPFVRETPRQGYLLLALLAAVGLGPGVHNLLLFIVAG